LWQNERNLCPHSQPHERLFLLVCWQEWLVRDEPLYLKFWAKLTPFIQNADFQLIIIRSISAVTPSENSSIITNRKSTVRFSMSLRWTVYVASKPPKEAPKRKMAVFHLKVNFTWSLLQSFFVWTLNSQRQSCTAFTGLSNHAKKVGGRRPILRQILA